MKTVIFEFQPTPEQPPWLPAAGRREDARMRNTHIDLHDALDRALVAIGNDYPAGHLLDAHAHRRAQLLYGATGVMLVLSEDGGWVVPPQRAVWIPAGVTHQVRMLGVSTRSACYRAARSDDGALVLATAAASRWTRAPAPLPNILLPRDARGWGVVPGLHGGAGHPLAAAGLGRAAAHESAQLQPPFPRAHRHVLRPMASARLRGAGAGAAGGGRSRHRHRAGFRLPGPGRVLNDVQARAGRGAPAYLRTD